MQDDSKESQIAALEALGLSYSAVFVPQSHSRNAGNKQPSINWRITLSKPGGHSLTTDYMQGVAHLEGYQHGNKTYDYGRAVRYAAEAGKWAGKAAGQRLYATPKTLPAPALVDVLSSLVLDAEVLQHACFEDWAQEYGYDTDSREAEAIYRACLDIALKLRAMVGESGLRTLQEIFNG